MMSRIWAWAAAVAGLFLLSTTAVRADDVDPAPFDIFRADSGLVVWVDLSSLLSAERVDRLKNGIDMEVVCRASIIRPRRLMGEVVCLEASNSFDMGYHVVSDEFYLQGLSTDSLPPRRFSSLARLHRFLADSLVVSIPSLKGLDARDRHVLRIVVSCISLTAFNLRPNTEVLPDGGGPLGYLFRAFLDLTGFGRDEIRLESEPFFVFDLSQKE